MAFVPAPQVIELVPRFRNTTTLATSVNVINVRKTSGSVTAADLEAVSAAYGTWFVGAGNDEVSTGIQLVEISTRDLTAEDSFIDTNVMSPAISGQVANPVMPMNVTLALRLTTGFAGRSRRGRLYFIGLPEQSVSGDYILTAPANGIVEDYTTLKNALATAGYEWVVVSRVNEGVPRTTALITPITAVSYYDLRVDSQRRRLVGEGT